MYIAARGGNGRGGAEGGETGDKREREEQGDGSTYAGCACERGCDGDHGGEKICQTDDVGDGGDDEGGGEEDVGKRALHRAEKMGDYGCVGAFLCAHAGIYDGLRGEKGHDGEKEKELEGYYGAGEHHCVRET